MDKSASPSHGENRREPVVIPKAAIRRLSLYLRQLEVFLRDDQQTVSSAVLGRALEVTDAQVRKDLAYFGQFGYPGVGYRVEELIGAIKRILGTDRLWLAALVGVGNLGRALMQYRGFAHRGFQILVAFDSDPTKAGGTVAGRPILPLDRMEGQLRERNVRLGVLAVPAGAAQEVADKLVAAGVRGILNFAPVRINVREGVRVVSVDLAIQLEQLCFQVQNLEAVESIEPVSP